MTMDVKQPGDQVYVLGMTKPELGASEYFALQGAIGNSVPKVDAAEALKLYRALNRAIGQGLVSSCHDCSDGGLGVALAESAFAGGLGMDIDLRMAPAEGLDRTDFLLFSETQSRFVVTVSPENCSLFEACMKSSTCARVGSVRPDCRFSIVGLQGSTVIATDIAALKRSWQKTLEWM
jgi:phosphoribosylformylglycinamidine synthase